MTQPSTNPCVVILDKVLFTDRDACAAVNKIINNRHALKLHTIVAENFITYKQTPPPDYVFIYNYALAPYRKRVFEFYCEIFPSFEVFCGILDGITQNGSSYECVVIDNTVKSDKLEDRVFWYKANLRPPFKVGPAADKVEISNNVAAVCV